MYCSIISAIASASSSSEYSLGSASVKSLFVELLRPALPENKGFNTQLKDLFRRKKAGYAVSDGSGYAVFNCRPEQCTEIPYSSLDGYGVLVFRIVKLHDVPLQVFEEDVNSETNLMDVVTVGIHSLNREETICVEYEWRPPRDKWMIPIEESRNLNIKQEQREK
ncbi:hypothetical protein Tco_1086280 [Tanacetum coccineum]